MMRDYSSIYDSLSSLLSYPQEGFSQTVKECTQALSSPKSPALEPVTAFAELVQNSTVYSLQELYTRTFEINPLCALEVGWQLFGERYERGTFIVKMRQTLRAMDLPESSELPDHLIHVLQALGRMEADEAAEFAETFVLPAVEKMVAGFKHNQSVYRDILNGIIGELRERYNLPLQGVKHV